MKSRLQKKWNNGKMLAELKPAFFLSLTFCFMIFIYAPLELYINNVDEFWYDVYLLFPFIIKDFFLFLLFSIVGFLVVYLFGNIAYKIVLYCYFTGTVACYIQGNYMVKNLPPLDGTDVNWSLYQSQFVKSTIVWVIIAIVCLILFIVLKYDRIKKADMFYKQTIKAKTVIDRVETAVEALNLKCCIRERKFLKAMSRRKISAETEWSI